MKLLQAIYWISDNDILQFSGKIALIENNLSWMLSSSLRWAPTGILEDMIVQ